MCSVSFTQLSRSAGPVDHTCLLPSNRVVLLPHMLSNHRLLVLSFPACILVLANSLLQPSCRFPFLTFPLCTPSCNYKEYYTYYTRTHTRWYLILDPGELCSQSASLLASNCLAAGFHYQGFAREATPITNSLIGKRFPLFSMYEFHVFLGFFSRLNQSSITHYIIYLSLYKSPHHVSLPHAAHAQRGVK